MDIREITAKGMLKTMSDLNTIARGDGEQTFIRDVKTEQFWLHSSLGGPTVLKVATKKRFMKWRVILSFEFPPYAYFRNEDLPLIGQAVNELRLQRDIDDRKEDDELKAENCMIDDLLRL